MKPDTLIDLVELHTTYKSEFSKKRIRDIIHQFLDQTPVSETHPSLSARSAELIDAAIDKNNQNYSVVIEDMVKHLTLITAERTSLTVIK